MKEFVKMTLATIAGLFIFGFVSMFMMIVMVVNIIHISLIKKKSNMLIMKEGFMMRHICICLIPLKML